MAEIKVDSQFRFAGSVAGFAIQQVLGPEELFRSLRQSWLRRKSGGWKEVTGTLRGRCFLRWAARAGWFEAVYTYEVDGQVFIGSLLRWTNSKAPINGSDAATIAFANRFPTDSPVRVRVDSANPARAVGAPAHALSCPCSP
jgi:hypothetical protein